MLVDIITELTDTTQEKFTFNIDVGYGYSSSILMKLDAYHFYTKPSRRHRKWEVQKQWQRLNTRETWKQVTRESIQVTPAIVDRVKEEILKRLEFDFSK